MLLLCLSYSIITGSLSGEPITSIHSHPSDEDGVSHVAFTIGDPRD